MSQVLGLVNASMAAGLVLNVIYILTDPPWLRALGGFVTTAIGIAVLSRFWQVFPFDFGDATVDWALWTRVALVVGLVASVIGLLVQTAALVRAAVVVSGEPDRKGREADGRKSSL